MGDVNKDVKSILLIQINVICNTKKTQRNTIKADIFTF